MYRAFCRVSNGLSDAQLEDYTEKFKDCMMSMKNKGEDDVPDWMEVPKDRIPDYIMKTTKNCEVWEVKGFEITKSDNTKYNDGYTIRFPRIVKIRDDKGIKQSTTFQEILQLRENSLSGKSLKKRKAPKDEDDEEDDDDDEEEKDTKKKKEKKDKKKDDEEEPKKKKRKLNSDEEKEEDVEMGEEKVKQKKKVEPLDYSGGEVTYLNFTPDDKKLIYSTVQDLPNNPQNNSLFFNQVILNVFNPFFFLIFLLFVIFYLFIFFFQRSLIIVVLGQTVGQWGN